MQQWVEVDEGDKILVERSARHLPRLKRHRLLMLTALHSPYRPLRIAALAADDRHWNRYTLNDVDTALALVLRQGEQNPDEPGLYDIAPFPPKPSVAPIDDGSARRIEQANQRHDSAVRRVMLLAHQLARAGRGDGPNVALRKVIAPNTSVPAPPLLVAG